MINKSVKWVSMSDNESALEKNRGEGEGDYNLPLCQTPVNTTARSEEAFLRKGHLLKAGRRRAESQESLGGGGSTVRQQDLCAADEGKCRQMSERHRVWGGAREQGRQI